MRARVCLTSATLTAATRHTLSPATWTRRAACTHAACIHTAYTQNTHRIHTAYTQHTHSIALRIYTLHLGGRGVHSGLRLGSWFEVRSTFAPCLRLDPSPSPDTQVSISPNLEAGDLLLLHMPIIHRTQARSTTPRPAPPRPAPFRPIPPRPVLDMHGCLRAQDNETARIALSYRVCLPASRLDRRAAFPMNWHQFRTEEAW